jgi:hypothetical protein
MTKQITPLRQRMRDDRAMRNMSPNTQKVYTYAVDGLAIRISICVPAPTGRSSIQSFGQPKQRVESKHRPALVTTKLHSIVPREELKEDRVMAQVSSALAGAAESYELMIGRWARRLSSPKITSPSMRRLFILQGLSHAGKQMLLT